MKQAYICISGDIIHPGHIKLIEKARSFGEVVVGLLTDAAIVNHKRMPLFNYEHRKKIVENLFGVKQVIPQESYDYIPNLQRIKPDYVVHGDNWEKGPNKLARDRICSTLQSWGGYLVEVPYQSEFSSTQLADSLNKGVTPEARMKKLRFLLQHKAIVRILEAHNGLTGLVVENTKLEQHGVIKEFDGVWVSSLTDSFSKGKPDTECVDITSRIATINQIFEVTTKPMIVDGDTGGLTEHFTFFVKTLERLGVSAVIIEDKIGAKRNSLFGTEVEQVQDTIENFCHKITEGKKAQVTDDFMIIGRIESLILEQGLADALARAESYIHAGADGIMIHSKMKSPQEIFAFCKEFNRFRTTVPLVVVPTTYCSASEQELVDAGANIIIYANHLLRSAYLSMLRTAQKILEHNRSFEAEELCTPIKDILTLIPGNK